jgi:hypothetical protein
MYLDQLNQSCTGCFEFLKEQSVCVDSLSALPIKDKALCVKNCCNTKKEAAYCHDEIERNLMVATMKDQVTSH